MPESDPASNLADLYIQSGLVIPVSYFPLAKYDIHRLLDSLASKTEDEAIQNHIALASVALELRDEIYFGASLSAAIEYNLLTDKGFEDYERLYWRNEPFSVISLYLQNDYRLCLDLELAFIKVYEGSGVSNVPFPIQGNWFPIDNHFISKGYFWYNLDPLSIEIGRNRVHQGPLRNALGLSSRLPFMDMIRLRLPLGGFSLDWIVSTPENRPQGSGLGSDITFTTLLSVHRIEYAFPSVRIGLEELTIFYRPGNTYVFGDIFPIFVFHQADINPNNTALIADVDWVIIPGLRAMAQISFDDINANLIGVGDSGATIDAEMLGLEYSLKTEPFDFKAYLELGRTHYLFGNFEDKEAEAIYHMITKREVYTMPLTSPFGPGADWIWLDFDFNDVFLEGAGSLDLGFGFKLIVKTAGVDLDIDYEANGALASGPKSLTTSIYASAQWRLFPWLILSVAPNMFITTEKSWFECIFSVKVSGDFHT